MEENKMKIETFKNNLILMGVKYKNDNDNLYLLNRYGDVNEEITMYTIENSTFVKLMAIVIEAIKDMNYNAGWNDGVEAMEDCPPLEVI